MKGLPGKATQVSCLCPLSPDAGQRVDPSVLLREEAKPDSAHALCQGRSKTGSSSHLMKNGQSFGIFVLIWDLGGIDDTQT